VWRPGGDAAQMDGRRPEGVGAPEDRAHVVAAAYVVEDDDQRHLGRRTERLDGEAVQFVVMELLQG